MSYFWDLIHVETKGSYDYITCEEFKDAPRITETVIGINFTNKRKLDGGIHIEAFPLSHIDNMREDILAYTKNNAPFTIDKNTYAPYGLPLNVAANGWTSS